MTNSRAQHWEERYAGVDRLWSGRPNDWLPQLAADWEPGTALDIGCGEGADTLWLAERGWQVTAIDLSHTAVGRLRTQAEQAGLSARITASVCDASRGLPAGPFDLATCFYVHGGPGDGHLLLGQLLAGAAQRLSPGGRLLVAVHAVNPPWHTHAQARTYTATQVLDEIGQAIEGWEVVVAEERWREVQGPQGQSGRRADAVVCLRKPAAGAGQPTAPGPTGAPEARA